VKAWLSQEDIPFEERNVHEDPRAESSLKRLLGRVVFPVVVFDEMEVVVGDKPDRLRSLAKEYGYLS
jgi:glutaredoxin